MYFVGLFFITQILSCVSGEPEVVFPQKLTVKQLKQFTTHMRCQDGLAAHTCWFKNYVEQEKKLVMDEIDPLQLLPRVLLKLIADYATPHSDVYKKVLLEAMHGAAFLSSYYVDIPLRVTLSQSGVTQWLFCHEDAYRAWVQGILNINNFQEWSKLIMCAHSEEFPTLLSKVQEVDPADKVKFNGQSGLSKMLINYSSKSVLDCSLAVYWQNEKKVFFTKNSKPILSKKFYTFDTTIIDGCYNILTEHNILKKDVSKKDLIIFCTSCNGQIKKPTKGVEELLEPHDVSDESPFCSGHYSRCRTFRALRVFLKQNNRIQDNCIPS